MSLCFLLIGVALLLAHNPLGWLLVIIAICTRGKEGWL